MELSSENPPKKNTSSSLNINRAVDWDKFIDFAQKSALTEPGKVQLDALKNSDIWAADLASSQLMQNETQEITPLLNRDALWGPLAELIDPSLVIERLERGSILEVAELSNLRRWLYAVDSWTQIPREEIRGERFKKTLSLLPDPYNILKILEQVLTPEGELSEKASQKLATLFSEIRSLKKEINNVLDHLMKTFAQKGVLQENFSDVRDGRFVIPIKISSQHEVDGIIYEASASRQTVFIEPKEVSALNNRLRQKQNDLIQEIFVVLTATSKQLQPFGSEIELAVIQLVHWDVVQAKARFARNYSGKAIHVTEERTFVLNQTAHPLLWWSMPTQSIIRNDLEFGHPHRALLITGPNTGGKTVLLKTLGLAGICARTGFPFPATDHPKVPFFESFFADLGDSQSIENHISSFSGHVLKFKEILEQTTPRSFILIDELNSATDPEEGAAFGRAILETIMEMGALIITTTHDPHLKALAVSNSKIVNASMAFDETSRTPTFRMVLGVPGRSRALETAKRLGISEGIIELAKSYLSQEHNEFERMLEQLEQDTQEAAKARKQAVLIQTEAERMKKEWTERTESSVNDMMDRTRQKLRRIVEQAQDEVRSSVRKLDEMKNRRSIDQTRTQLNETLQQISTKIDVALEEEAPEIAALISRAKTAPPAETAPSKLIEVGSKVRIPKWKNTGIVLQVSDSKVKVAMGTLQMSLSLHEVEVIASSPNTQKQAKVTFSGHGSGSEPSYLSTAEVEPKIDLRGTRLDEAMSQLRQYLDSAFRNSSRVEVTIVHGLGTGALREGAIKLLRKLPYIKTFRDGGHGHGGAGATIVEIDR